MPTYDYACQACGHEFEEFQSMTAKPLRKCPECGKMKLQRLIGTGAGVIFKGSGFYETDYRSDSYRKAAEAEKKDGSGDAKGESGDKAGSEKKDAGKDAGKTTNGAKGEKTASSSDKAGGSGKTSKDKSA